MRRTVVVRSTAALVAVLGLGGCGQSGQSEHPSLSAPAPAPTTSSVAMPAPIPDSPGGPPLPPANALIDVMARLSDPALPGEEKVTLIENGTPGEAAALDRFAVALRDNGSLPLSFEARDLAWSQSAPGHVVATVVIRPANPAGSEFTFPMEFAPAAESWQLTRQTADLLLQLDDEPAPPAPPTPPR